MMNVRKAFDVGIYNLSPGVHEFNFEIDGAFFESYEYGIVEQGQLRVVLLLENQETFLTLNFSIEGTIELLCDRSLELFDYPLDLKERVILKYGSEEIGDEEDIEIIAPGTTTINVADYIYEFITVSVPMKKLHPRYQKDRDVGEEDLFYTTEGEQEEEQDQDNPLWKELKKLKN